MLLELWTDAIVQTSTCLLVRFPRRLLGFHYTKRQPYYFLPITSSFHFWTAVVRASSLANSRKSYPSASCSSHRIHSCPFSAKSANFRLCFRSEAARA